MTNRTLNNDLCTSHNRQILIFDLDPPGKAEVEFVCRIETGSGDVNYQYLCNGACFNMSKKPPKLPTSPAKQVKTPETDAQFWRKVAAIAARVDTWPQWKREGWAVLDRRES